MVRLWHREDDVRISQMPPGGKFGRFWQLLSIPFRHACLHPFLDQSHLLLRQSPLSQKFTVPRDWSPRWHYFSLHNRRDQASMLANIVVAAQRKRRDFSGPMASDAIIIEQWSNIAAIGRAFFGRERNARACGDDHKHNRN